MYERHFRLREPPFSLTPDTGYYFSYPDHQEALNVLLVALHMGEGFIKVTGEVGTGKTLVCRKLLNALAQDPEMVTAYIPNPSLSATALRQSVAEELGVDVTQQATQHQVVKLITDRLIELRAAGNKVTLLIDEAQALPAESLEAVRLLTNLETEKSKLLQVVLFGQPELDGLLARPDLRQLRQRITFAQQIHPLNLGGTVQYLLHRLAVAGNDSGRLISWPALKLLHRGSRGVPRLLNTLSHKSLLAAYGEGAMQVKPGHVRRAIRDTEEAARLYGGLFYRLAALLRSRFTSRLGSQI